MDQAVATPEATPAPVAPDPAVTATPEVPQEEPKKPDRVFTQAELDEILEKRLSKERRKRQEIENRLRITEDIVLKTKPEAPKPEPVANEGPKRDAFESYEAYLEAKAEWKAEQALDRRLAEREKKEKETKTLEGQRQAAESFKKTAEKFAAETEDFNDVMSSSDAPMTEAMAKAIYIAGEDGPRVAYHLAKNPSEAERIASMPEAQQAREIWAIEMKLKSAPAPKKPSKAPEPIAPVGGKASTAADTEITGKETPEEFLRKRNAQLKARRG